MIPRIPGYEPSSPTSRGAGLPPGRLGRPRHPDTSPVTLQCRRTPQLEQPRESGRIKGTPGRSRPDSLPPTSQTGYLVHALQTTLGTFSLLFKSPPGEEGKKYPEEIRVNWEEKSSKGCPQQRKSPDSAGLQTTTALSGGCGETVACRDLTRNLAPSATSPLFSVRKDSSSTTGGPPSWCWANTEAVKPGHQRVLRSSTYAPPSAGEGTSEAEMLTRFFFLSPIQPGK